MKNERNRTGIGRETVEKQIAKKPVFVGDVGKADFPCYMWKCPTSGHTWCGSEGFQKYCPECGQKLNWT